MTVDWQKFGSNTYSTLGGEKTADAMKSAQDFLNGAISASNVFVGLAGSAGIAGFVFDIAEDESVELGSMITDHYIESGSPIQDHIALRPEKVTVRGLVGEYKDIITGEKSFLQKATEKLTTLASYLPAVSQAAGSVYDGLKGLNSAQSGKDVFNSLSGTGSGLFEAYKNINIPQNEQQKAFIFFEALRNAKATFTVQTPFRYYTDMAIESIRCTQRANTEDLSNFEITLKKMRFVTTQIQNTPSCEIENGELEDRLEEQAESVQDEGLLSSIWSSGKNTVGGWFKGGPEVVEIPRDAPDWEAQWDAAKAEGKIPW